MRVTGLFLYPVKACGAVPVAEAEVGTYGFVGDREWLVVGDDGVQLTQRQLPSLALLRPRAAPAGGVVLTAPGAAELAVERPTVTDSTVEVWGRELAVGDAGDAAAQWLTSALGRPARLAAIAPGYERPVGLAPQHQVSFADGFPVLLCTEASLAELNELSSEPVPMERFRPNLVVDGDAPWEDDDWIELQVGEARFTVVKPCSRCAVPQVDQRNATRHKEPARALAAHRRDAEGKVLFGQNLVQLDIGATVALGDEVRVLSRR